MFLSAIASYVGLMCLMSTGATSTLAMGGVLIFLAAGVCVTMGVLTSGLMALLVFQMYVGGLLVLFGYMLSVLPNEGRYDPPSWGFLLFFFFFV